MSHEDPTLLIPPLHRAAENGDEQEVLTLLTSGFSVDVYDADQEGVTPLYCAAARGQAAVVRLLLQHGADPNAPCCYSRLTPVHGAAQWGHAEIMDMLLRAGGDLEAKDYHNRTPLDYLEDWQAAQPD